MLSLQGSSHLSCRLLQRLVIVAFVLLSIMPLNMGLGVADTAKRSRGSESGASSSNRALEEEVKMLKEQVKLLTKASLSAHQAIRLLKAILIGTLRMASGSQISQVAEENRKAYDQAAKSYKGDQEALEEGLGLPAPHLFVRFLETALEISEGEPSLAEHHATMQKMMDHIAAMDLKPRLVLLAEAVKLLKVKSAFDKKFCKLEFSIVKGSDCENVFQSMLVVMELASNRTLAKSFKMHLGQAPRGELERAMQRYLETSAE